jgi:hypothetical protein
MLFLQSTAGNSATLRLLPSDVVQRAPKQPPLVIPPSPSRQAMTRQLLDEHPGLHANVADEAVDGAVRVMGAGGAGGDVVLDPHVTREVSVHTGRLDEQNLTSHLQNEARQAGVREIYLQVNSPGATSQAIRQAMNKIQNGVRELAGVRVRVYDHQGRMVWKGNMQFRDTDPARSRPGGGGGGAGGGGGGAGGRPVPGPPGSGPAPRGSGPGTGPTGATGTGPGGGAPPTSTPTTSTMTSATTRTAMAKAITQSRTGVARAVALTGRITVYIKAFGVLTHLLTLLSAIDSMQKLLAHGTAMPDEQRQADRVLSDSNRAKDEADQATEDIDLVHWVTLSGEAERANDDETLFAIDEAASAVRRALEDSAAVAQGLAEDLEASSKSIQGEMLKRLVGILMPNPGGTAHNSIEFALYASLERLHGTTLAASRNYAEAAGNLNAWAVQFRGIDRWANDAAWAIARGKAMDRYRATHPEAGGSNKP